MKAKTLYVLIVTGLILMGGIVAWLGYLLIFSSAHEEDLLDLAKSQHHSVGSVAAIQGKVTARSIDGEERVLPAGLMNETHPSARAGTLLTSCDLDFSSVGL